MIICYHCGRRCKNNSVYEKHLKKSPICARQKEGQEIAYGCKKCFFMGNTPEELYTHQCRNVVQSLREERIKVRLLSEVISTYTPLKIQNILSSNADQPVITGSPSNEDKSDKKLRLDEDPKRIDQKIKHGDAVLNEIKRNKFDFSLKETRKEIEQIFETLSRKRAAVKSPLEKLRQLRSRLLGQMNLNKYISLLRKHIKRIASILSHRRTNQSRTEQDIRISLSGLDQRLIFYPRYYESEIESDHLQMLQDSLKVNTSYPRSYVPYDESWLIKEIRTYALALSSIGENLERLLVNPYGFYSLVYHQTPKSTDKDPFSFYYLSEVKEGQRYWRMDLRLEGISERVSYHVAEYCIDTFRRIYNDAFGDYALKQATKFSLV